LHEADTRKKARKLIEDERVTPIDSNASKFGTHSWNYSSGSYTS